MFSVIWKWNRNRTKLVQFNMDMIRISGADECLLLMVEQLYKTRDDKYLLDLQRVHGPQFLFLDLCAAFLAQLRVL